MQIGSLRRKRCRPALLPVRFTPGFPVSSVRTHLGGAVSQTQSHFWGLVISVHLGLALHTPAVGAFTVRVPVRVAPSPFIRRSFGAQDEPVLSNCRSAEPSVTRAETRAPPHAGPGRTAAPPQWSGRPPRWLFPHEALLPSPVGASLLAAVVTAPPFVSVGADASAGGVSQRERAPGVAPGRRLRCDRWFPARASISRGRRPSAPRGVGIRISFSLPFLFSLSCYNYPLTFLFKR